MQTSIYQYAIPLWREIRAHITVSPRALGEFMLVDFPPERLGQVIEAILGLCNQVLGGWPFAIQLDPQDCFPNKQQMLSRTEDFDQLTLWMNGVRVLVQIDWIARHGSFQVGLYIDEEALLRGATEVPNDIMCGMLYLLKTIIDAGEPRRGVFLVSDAQYDGWDDKQWRTKVVLFDATAGAGDIAKF